jgi:hypothetical protein
LGDEHGDEDGADVEASDEGPFVGRAGGGGGWGEAASGNPPFGAGARALAGDLERRCGPIAHGAVVRRLLKEGRTLAALRYVQRHKVEAVPPEVFFAAAAAHGDPVVCAAVYRFCAENVPDFQTMADFVRYHRLLQQGGGGDGAGNF